MFKKILIRAALFAVVSLLPTLVGQNETLIQWVGVAEAGEFCRAKQSCRTEVKKEVQRQTAAASGGPRWQLTKSGCAIASREQEGNARRCRAYDNQAGGKTFAQCAKCYRQAVFDTARWEQCYQKGWAPPVAAAQYTSIAVLGKEAAAKK